MATTKSLGTARVEKGRYELEGKFHRIEPGTPIRREDGKLCGVTKPRSLIHLHSYGGEAVFFEGLTKRKIYATRCDNPACDAKGSIFLPFRIYCPDCLRKATVIDVTDLCRKTATIYSFIVTERTGAFNTLKIPIKFINVSFEGVCTILMSYLSVGEPKIGMRVVPIFRTRNPTYTIEDLSWVPEGTPDSKLPKGFTF